jgi:hypothetical protein
MYYIFILFKKYYIYYCIRILNFLKLTYHRIRIVPDMILTPELVQHIWERIDNNCSISQPLLIIKIIMNLAFISINKETNKKTRLTLSNSSTIPLNSNMQKLLLNINLAFERAGMTILKENKMRPRGIFFFLPFLLSILHGCGCRYHIRYRTDMAIRKF